MNTSACSAPLSVNQVAMWVDWDVDPSQWKHIVPTPFSVDGHIDMMRLKQAVTEVCTHFPQLQARVIHGAGGPTLDWSKPVEVPVREWYTDQDRDTAIRQTWQVPFDLTRGPLLRVELIKGSDWTVLLISAHHLVYDGTSILLLLDALTSAYAGEKLSRASPAPALRAFAQRSWDLADTPAGARHRDYWRGALTCQTANMSLAPNEGASEYQLLREDIPDDLTAALQARANELRVSTTAVLFSGYMALLRHYGGTDQPLSFIPFHGRTDPNSAEHIGYFSNLLPVQCQVHDSDSYSDLIRRLAHTVQASVRHGDLPHSAIMRSAWSTDIAERIEKYQALFQVWDARRREGVDVRNLRFRAPGADATLQLLDMGSSAGFTLALVVRTDHTGIHLLWKDTGGAFKPAVFNHMASDYQIILRAIADDPWASIMSTVPGAANGNPPLPEMVLPAGSVDDAQARARTITVGQDVPGIDTFAAQNMVEFPASSFQEHIHLAERLMPGHASHNVPVTWKVVGHLDAAELGKALARTVKRNEILRTAFHERDGRALQVVMQPWSPEIMVIDVSERPDPWNAAQDWMAQASHQVFDLTSGKLLRAALIDLGAEEQILFFCIHHLLWDGESRRILLAELAAHYLALTPTPTALLEPEGANPPTAECLLPASPHQRHLWFADRPGTDDVQNVPTAHHNLSVFLRIRSLPTPDSLARAARVVATAHTAVRTTLGNHKGQIVQYIHEDSHLTPEWLSTRQDSADAEGQNVPETLSAWAAHPFDLSSPPLVRIAVLPEPGATGWLSIAGHQAVVDRRSLRLLAGDLLAALSGNIPQPSNYGAWLSEQGSEDTTHLEVGAAVLEPLNAPLQLPHLRANKVVRAHQDCSVPLRLPHTDAITTVASYLGVEPSTVLLASFGALLEWYSGQDDIVVGVSDAGRSVEDRHVVGPLANLLPIRLRPKAGMPFAVFAAAVKAEVTYARQHSRASFGLPAKAITPASEIRATTSFDTVFTYLEEELDSLAVGTTEADIVEPTIGGQYDLRLCVGGSPGTSNYLAYNGLRYDHDQMASMATHFCRIVELFLDDPHQTIGEVEPLTADERQSQLTTWNRIDGRYPDKGIHDLVREQAQLHPSSTAVTDGATSFTYLELVNAAEALARQLRADGVTDGELVALLLPAGVDQIRTVLAVLMAGAGYLPIDPESPEDRISFILEDAGAKRIIVSSRTVEHRALVAFDGNVSNIDDPIPVELLPEKELPTVSPDSTAYCMYTSGTTGQPKGVVITHRNVVQLLLNDQNPLDFGPTDVWAMFHAYTFDVSVWEIFGCLLSGGRLVTFTTEQVRDPNIFTEILRAQAVSVLNLTPSAFKHLFASQHAETFSLSTVRYMIFAGEALQPHTLIEWAQQHPQVRIVNMYGITETTVLSTFRIISREDMDTNLSVIGMALPTSSILLLDRHTGRRLLPIGAVGEIYVGGHGVAAGYLNRPELSAQRFVSTPLGDEQFFRSGDLAWYQPDGSLVFVGRCDTQVQVRGYRVELGEVETVLLRYPEIDTATVLLEGETLAAYVTCRKPVTARQLRHHLAASLPEYMIPSSFRMVDALPLTPNGKLDVNALRATATILHSPGSAEQLTETGSVLARIWTSLLGVEPGRADSFFALGGHSLLAVQLNGAIAAHFGVTLSMRTIFEAPRLGELADLVDRESGGIASVSQQRSGRNNQDGSAATLLQRSTRLAEPDIGSVEKPDRQCGERVLELTAQPQYQDYVAWQTVQRESERHGADIAYWLERLKGAPTYLTLRLPHLPEPNGSVPVPVADNLAQRLQALAGTFDMSMYMVAATALAMTLHHWTGSDDVVFNSRMADRGNPAFTNLLGPCVNTVVLRSQLVRESSALDVLKTMRSEVLSAAERGSAPFEDVLKAVRPSRKPGRTPYGDVSLVVVSEPPMGERLGGCTLHPFDIDFVGAEFVAKQGLSVCVTTNSQAVVGKLTYRGDRWHRQDVEELAHYFGQALEVLAVAPAQPLRSAFKEAVGITQTAQNGTETPMSGSRTKDGELEQAIAGIWQDVLEIREVGIHDNFFDLGGDSLKLATVHSRLVTRLKWTAPITALFEHPTVSAIAMAVRGTAPVSGSSGHHEVQRRPRRRRR